MRKKEEKEEEEEGDGEVAAKIKHPPEDYYPLVMYYEARRS